MAVLIALTNALVVALPLNNSASSFFQKAWRLRHAFFISCLFAPQAFALCSLAEADKVKAVKLESKSFAVIDGDSLRFGSEQLRLIAVNTPEYKEPLADKAKAALGGLVYSGTEIYWLKGSQEKDRYGRVLSHLFLSDGRNVAALLVQRGLGFAVAIPPNVEYSGCVFEQEAVARKKGKGIWQNAYFEPVDAKAPPSAMAGFKRVTGKLVAVNKSKKSWWLQLDGDVVLKVGRVDQSFFDEKALMRLLQKRIEVSGWVVDRQKGKSPPSSRYSRYMLLLRHPLHLQEVVN